jgi:BlaI family transcriptional regulator, penicillinase repressor
MTTRHQLGDLQLAIMRVLWARGEASASDVHAALLEERGLAPTTIATMLRKMEDKGVVVHRANGRQFIYLSVIAESDVRQGMVGDLVERLFLGNPAALVSHLLNAGEIDAAELAELRSMLDQYASGESGGLA